ncbi:MAG: hypothetical protein RMJ84_05520, partial [Sandaracinaceae bacterium]|nr:hypothetical protein [Sandaracinaceae bacterium]
MSGRGNCDGQDANGCEVDTNTNPMHCGGCNRVCSGGNANWSCRDGACRIESCMAGYGDCDGDPTNGCETNLMNSIGHCGRCGNRCMGGNATWSCVGGVCSVASCNSGYGDCDRDPSNGCETNLNTSLSHCGMCGNACMGGNATWECVGGVCLRQACNSGYGDCDGNAGNGCETDVNTTVAHCGRCGNACSGGNATWSCVGGVCRVASC